jgi:hypothetical protein
MGKDGSANHATNEQRSDWLPNSGTWPHDLVGQRSSMLGQQMESEAAFIPMVKYLGFIVQYSLSKALQETSIMYTYRIS